MGDPKKLHKKYQTPFHPWSKKVIEEEKLLVKEYGLKKKKEIHIANSFLKKYKDLAKKLIANETAQGVKEKEQILSKLARYGLIMGSSKLDDVLKVELKDVLNRRLQTIVHKNGLARSVRQARQFITHGHALVGNKRVTSPSYLVPLAEESLVSFRETSSLAQGDHPERVAIVKVVKKRAVKTEPARGFRRGRR